MMRTLFKRAVPASWRQKFRLVKIYRRKFGKTPNFWTPRTFNDHLTFERMWKRDPRLPRLADKVLVKEYVSERLPADWIVPTVWFGSELPASEPHNWPERFVIKANHGSGMNFFYEKGSSSWAEAKAATAEWLDQDFGYLTGEWHYAKISRQLLVEPMLCDFGDTPDDFKIFVFGGRPRLIQVDTGRFTDHRRQMLDTEWQKLPFEFDYPAPDAPPTRPNSINEMLRAAAILADDIPFVRVDFYEIGGKPLFGEMTFVPAAGLGVFTPASYDRTIGNFWPR